MKKMSETSPKTLDFAFVSLDTGKVYIITLPHPDTIDQDKLDAYWQYVHTLKEKYEKEDLEHPLLH